MTSKLIVLTDLHMLPEGERIIGIDPGARLRAAVSHINRHHADAARVVLTGDLAHRGEVLAYRRLRSLLEDLVPPCSLLIGNHDRREAFVEVFPEAPRDEYGFVQQVIDLPGTRLVLLDTLNGPPYRFPDSHAGALGASRLAWLDRQLSGAGARPVYLFMHHPPHATGFRGMDAIGLRDGADLYALLERHGNVRHLFAGHVHRTIGGSHRGIGFSIFKSPVHQQPMDFASEDCSLSVPEPAAYGIVFLEPDGVLVHTEDYELSGAPGGPVPEALGR